MAPVRHPRLDLAYDGTRLPRLGRPAGAAHRPGRRSRPRWPRCCGCPRCGSPAPGGPTPGCTPAARSSTSTSPPRRWRRPPDAPRTARSRRWCAGSTASCPPTCGSAGWPRPRRVRRAVLRALAPLRLPGRRPPGAGRPAARAHVLAWPRPLDLEADERGGRAAARRARLRRVLQAAEGATTIRTPARPRAGRATPTGSPWPTVRADAFCHHMVRSLVGCLLAVGEGRRTRAWAGRVLAAAAVRDPRVAVVPAHGLTLEEVAYPPDDELAAQGRGRRGSRRRTGPG